MSLVNTVRDASGGLHSDRAAERRRNAETLKQLLSSAASDLCANQINDSGFNYNNVFEDVHEFVLKECEKFESNRSFSNIQGLSANLLHLTVGDANKGKAYIKCEIVLRACLCILQSPRYTKAVGDIYVIMLNKYIIPCEHYLRFFTPQNWEDLLSACVSISCREQRYVDTLTSLRLIWQIMQSGQLYCHFVTTVRDVIPKLRQHYTQVNHENKIHEVLLSIGIELLKIMSAENRLTMCEFTETAIPVLLKSYDQNADRKKKTLLFHFLELAVKLHHPQGRLRGEMGSLAHDWNLWRRNLSNIMDLVKVEGDFLDRTLSDNKYKTHSESGNNNLCEHYAQLSAIVIYQIIQTDCHNDLLDEYEEIPAKRPRHNDIKMFGDLICRLRDCPVPWISVIATYIKLYLDTISRMNLAIVLSIVDNFISNTNSKINWTDFESMTCSILENIATGAEDETTDRIVLSLYSSCVRYCSVDTAAHGALHGIIKTVIHLNLINKKHLPQLLKLYNEGAMPVTCASIRTLNMLFSKYDSTLDQRDLKLKYLSWLHDIKLNSTNVHIVAQLLLHLITKESFPLTTNRSNEDKTDELFNIAFENPEAIMLASAFEVVLWNEPTIQAARKNHQVAVQTCAIIKDEVERYLCQHLNSQIDDFKKGKSDLIQYLQTSLYYYNYLLKYNICNIHTIENEELFNIICSGVDAVFYKISKYDTTTEMSEKYATMQSLVSLLSAEYDDFISRRLRMSADQEFFQVIHETINQDERTRRDDDAFGGDDPSEECPLRGIAIELCALYCKKNVQYREDVLEMILDPELYNFTSDSNIKSAFQCMDILMDNTCNAKPELLFRLMQAMCKELFRNTDCSIRLMKLLHTILESLGASPTDTLKNNCIIMLKGYLHRCHTGYYPPSMTALVYMCIVRIDELHHQNWPNTLNESVVKGLASPVHSLRLYTCYILKNSFVNINETGLGVLLTNLMKIYQFEVSADNEGVLKDEAANRTSTVLHCVSALMLAKPMWTTKLIAALLEIAREKAINKTLVKKVLDMVVTKITGKPAHEYLRNNILSLLYFWFNGNVDVMHISYEYFGYENIRDFFKKHMNWLIPTEILWTKKGNIRASTLLPFLRNELKINEDDIINNCFCYMFTLSCAYKAHNEYDVPCPQWMKANDFGEGGMQMLKATIEWVGDDKLRTLCVQHFGTIVLLTTMSLLDPDELVKEFNWKGSVVAPEPRHFSIQTYDLVLQYYGKIMKGNILRFLCENQPLAISHILLNLWSQIETEMILESKLISIYRYVAFFERVPMNTPVDSYICNFICNSLLNTLKASRKETRKRNAEGVICRALYKVLSKILPEKSKLIEQLIPQIISTLILLKQDKSCSEVDILLAFLVNEIHHCLKDSLDLVDDALAFTQGGMVSTNFLESLKKFIPKLTCYSLETLDNMNTLIKTNFSDLLVQCKNLKNLKGFSEDCKQSVIHQLINALIDIAAKSEDKECILAACHCLALIGPCDLKTLVMASPESKDQVVCLTVNPSQYTAFMSLQVLSTYIFDENAKVIQKTTSALKSILSHREGRFAMEQDLKYQKESGNLRPFISKSMNQTAVKSIINEDDFDTIFNTPCLWIPCDNEYHNDWLIRVMTSLINIFHHENTYYLEVLEVCKLKTSLAEKLIPPFVGLIISSANEHYLQLLSQQITAFFQHFFDKTFYSSQDSDGLLEKQSSHSFMERHKCSVDTMIRVVDFVRLQRSQYKKRKNHPDTYNYLDLNYHTIAWAAYMTGHSMSAVMYGELWCISQNDGVPPSSPEIIASFRNGENIQGMFRKSYVAIGEFDSVYGCGTGHLLSEAEKRNHILRLGNFGDALLMHDIALSHTPTIEDSKTHELHRGVIKSMHKSGLYHLAAQYIKCLPEDSNLDDVKYECFSKLGDWSLIVDKSSLETNVDQPISKLETSIKASQYVCLKDCLNITSTDGYEYRLRVHLDNARLCVSKFLQKSNLEHCQVIYNVTTNLQVLQEIEDYYELRCKKRPFAELLTKWDTTNLMPFDDFKHVEPVLSQRSLILEHAAKLDSSVVKDVIELQLKYAELAMLNNQQQMSSRLVALARKLEPGGSVSLMDARVFWANGNKDIALHLIKSVIQNAECTDRILRANALWQYGRWMTELRNESSREILDKYLKSLDTLGDGGHMETQLKVYLDLAKFADAEYEQVLAYTKSSIFENKVKCMEYMKGTAHSIKELMVSQTVTKDEQRAFNTNNKLSILEEAEITSTYKEKKRFLDLAMKYYLLSLSQGELSDLSIFRVISLWINNPSLEFDNTDDTLQQLLVSVPSTKYLLVLPQITPRLTMDDTPFVSTLNIIIERCATDHPHHTLPILLALSNSHKDKMILNASAKDTSQRARTSTAMLHEEPRIAAARTMIQRLSQNDEALEVIISQMDQMYNALISLAYYTVKEKLPKHGIPRAEPVTKLKKLNSVVVPIVNVPVKKDCIYTCITSVEKFSNDFSLVGGINAPKKMKCRGSDGVERTILLKGEDDMRQDAVMQQVFTIVNNLLEMNQETGRRKLTIRTYKVVPLSRRSGVLEWCEGTDTIGNFLVGTSNSPGAHSKYRPKDISHSAARQLLIDCANKGRNKEHKLAVFKKILSQFKPVFHHFFTENFLAPVTWYERRLAFTKSVATSSMVGYMLGIGDRHLQNILIDKKTAEAIHIDFGIAFDQAKTLPTPETVPFRLSQDIVAGFGSCGVEGVFRRSCEKTLQLLRDNQDTLLTILEVLLCDPLYTWTITAEQAKLKQNIPTTPGDAHIQGIGDSNGTTRGSGPAERALLAVRSKLCGTDGSAGGGMAVPGIVARLIQHATDIANLSQLFHGIELSESAALVSDFTSSIGFIGSNAKELVSHSGVFIGLGEVLGIVLSESTALVSDFTNSIGFIGSNAKELVSHSGVFIGLGEVLGIVLSESTALVSDFTNSICFNGSNANLIDESNHNTAGRLTFLFY